MKRGVIWAVVFVLTGMIIAALVVPNLYPQEAAVLLVPAAGAAPTSTRAVTLLVPVPEGATAWYTTPDSPVTHPIGREGKVLLSVNTTARGSWTFCVRKTGCLAAYRRLSVSQLLQDQAVVVTLHPRPFGTPELEQILKVRSSYSTPPALAARDQHVRELVVSAPDGSGAAVSRLYRVPDPARDDFQEVSEIWWCPVRPGKPVCIVGPLRVSYVCDLSFAPDGQWLACTFPEAQHSMHPTATEQIFYNPGATLWVYNLPTGERRRLAHLKAGCDFPCWSPDGASVAYVSPGSGPAPEQPSAANGGADDGGTVSALRLVRWDGRDDEIIARGVNESAPAFSPDGRLLVFCGAKGLQVIDLPSRHEDVLAAVAPAPRDGPAISWSPDGQWIAALANPLENSGPGETWGPAPFAYAIHRSGKPVRRISRGSLQIAWLPDGSLLVNGLADARTSRLAIDSRLPWPVQPVGVVLSMDEWPIGPALLPAYRAVGPMPGTNADGVLISLPQGLLER